MSHGQRRGNARVESRSSRVFSVLILFCLPATGLSQAITEYAIPTSGSGPSSIASGPDGALWFTESTGHKVGRITVHGAITEFELPPEGDSPTDITAGSDGNLWYISGSSLCRMTPAGEATCQRVGLYGALKQIISGPDGALWFTAETRHVGRALPSGGVSYFAASGVGDLNRIAFGADGNIWYSMVQGEWVGRMTTSGTTRDFPLPRHPTADSGVTAGPDNALWFGGNAGVLRLTPPDQIGNWSTRSFATGPATDLTFDLEGNLWYTGGEGLVGSLTQDGTVNRYGVGSAASITNGPDGNLWFVEPSDNRIGRIAPGVIAPLCVADEHTLCLNQNRFAVNASFQQTPLGPSVAATAVRLTADTGYFWFFDQNNVELVAKVLNGCGLTGSY